MKFVKMHGLGNDFAVVAEFSHVPADIATRAIAVCDRHFGVGADGLVLILPSDVADVQMRIFNADGTEPEQCGNAVRCVGKYAYDYGLVTSDTITVETRAGLQRLRLFLAEGRVASVEVDMGAPILQGLAVPTTVDAEPVREHPVAITGASYSITAVSMGNPHAVIFVDDLEQVPLHQHGPELETHALFPRKTNVEFVEVHSRTEVTMHVWERGVGETLACGSGACAVGVAGVLTGRTDRRVLVHLKGGDLQIDWREADGRVYMTGPAVVVYEGTLYLQ